MGRGVISGQAAPLLQANLDTDQIMPKQFLRRVDKEGLADGVFHDLRFDSNGEPRPDFVLNQAQHAQATILLAGENFGCGSSREHAVWGLLDAGIEAIIAPSFGEIFYSNAMNNRLLLIVLPASEVQHLAAIAEASASAGPSASVAAVAPTDSAMPTALTGATHSVVLAGHVAATGRAAATGKTAATGKAATTSPTNATGPKAATDSEAAADPPSADDLGTPVGPGTSIEPGVTAERQASERYVKVIQSRQDRSITIDLHELTISSAGRTSSFAISARHRRMFLDRTDLVEDSLTFTKQIDAFAEQYRQHHPWLAESVTSSMGPINEVTTRSGA